MADSASNSMPSWVSAVIPAFNEEATIANVVREIPRESPTK